MLQISLCKVVGSPVLALPQVCCIDAGYCLKGEC